MATASRLQISNQVGSGSNVGLGSTQVDIRAKNQGYFSELARIMERRPVVVGITTHGSNKKNPGKNQIAEFGWLIGPKLITGSDGATTYRLLAPE